MNEYEKIRVMLSAAEQLYEGGEISHDEFLAMIEEIKAHFEKVQKKIQEEEVRRILNKYFTDPS